MNTPLSREVLSAKISLARTRLITLQIAHNDSCPAQRPDPEDLRPEKSLCQCGAYNAKSTLDYVLNKVLVLDG